MTASPTFRATPVWALLVLTVLAYANSFAGTFQFDDRAVILDDPRVQSAAAFRASLGQGIRPLTRATFLVDRWLFGDRPAGYHVLNLLLHLTSGLLLYQILRHPSLHQSASDEGNGDRERIAFWTSLLFLVHPMATEAVTYISGRPTALMTCAYLAAFLFALQALAPDPERSAQTRWVGWSMACMAISLLAKETAIVFPALLLVSAWVLRPSPAVEARRALIRVYLSVSAVVVLFLALAAFNLRYAELFRNGLARGWYANVLTQANAVVYGMTLFVRPWALNFDHDLPLYSSLFHGPTFPALAVLAGLASVAVALRRRAPLVSFGILWFFVHLLPTNSFLARFDVLSERNLYLPSIGVYLAVAAATVSLAGWVRARLERDRLVASPMASDSPSAIRAMLAVLVVALVVATVRRNAIYGDAVTFWADAVAKSPRKARPHTNLGYARFASGDVDRAIDEFRLALTLDPLDEVAQRNLLEAWTLGAARSAVR